MKTVVLHGKKAAGRVALVDDGDYELVMQYRWHVHDPEQKPGHLRIAYAVTNAVIDGKRTSLRMHCLIMGIKGVDHADHDGLNNQRSNLRIATVGQNARNVRPRAEGTTSSKYKGVCYVGRGLWRPYITTDGQRIYLGDCASELEAAYVYDTAARQLHREFACLNFPQFPDGPTEAMRELWRTEGEARSAAVLAAARRAQADGTVQWWAQREPETFTCAECGGEFQSRAVGAKMYCRRPECRAQVKARMKRARRAELRRSGLRVT